MTYNPQRALDLLRIGSGRADANFREDQEDAIRHIVDGRGRLLVVQKTGWLPCGRCRHPVVAVLKVAPVVK